MNFFYECAALQDVDIGKKGDGYYNWAMTLRSENPSAWLKPHLPGLFERAQGVRDAGGKPRIKSLTLVAPGEKDLVLRDR